MKIIKAAGMWDGPFTVDNLDEMKPIYSVVTEIATYMANDLTEAMEMWRTSNDHTQVQTVGRLG